MSAVKTIERWAVQVRDQEGVWHFIRKGSHGNYSVVEHPASGTTYTKKHQPKLWLRNRSRTWHVNDTEGKCRYRLVKVKLEAVITEIVEYQPEELLEERLPTWSPSFNLQEATPPVQNDEGE